MKRFKASARREEGVVLVLLALLAAVILGLLALAVDANLGMSVQQQGREYMRLAALAALSKYYENTGGCTESSTDPACSHEQRMQKAIAAVRKITNSNVILMDTKFDHPVTDDPDEPDSILLEAGKWRERPEDCDQQPACFIPLQSGEKDPDAMRLSGRAAVVKTLFGGIFRVPNFRPRARATATVVPRHVYFLVDLSPTIVHDTFLRWLPTVTDPDPAKCVPPPPLALLSPPPPAAPVYAGGNDYVYLLDSDNPVQPPAEPLGVPHQQLTWLWDGFKDIRPVTNTSGLFDPSVNYRSDYKLKTTLTDADYNTQYYGLHPDPAAEPGFAAGADRKWYRVHTFRGDLHPGPEPLATIFTGINSAVEELRSRKVNGDKAGVMFFSHRLTWPATTKLVGDDSGFQYLKSLTDNYLPFGAEIQDDDKDNLDTGEWQNAIGLERTIRHGLFPEPGTYSNLLLAISEAARRLANVNDSSFSAKSIVLFTDGLLNCCSRAAGDPLADACTAVNGGECENDFAHYNVGAQQLRAAVFDRLVKAGISLHILPVGRMSGAHTVDLLKLDRQGTPTGGCYEDGEYRALSRNPEPYGMVRGGIEGNSNPTEEELEYAYAHVDDAPFYQAMADLYTLAVATRGVWAPLRPKDPTCGSGRSTAWTPPCNPGQRRTTDPFCRSIQEQIKDAMENAIGEMPYRVAEVE